MQYFQLQIMESNKEGHKHILFEGYLQNLIQGSLFSS